MNRRQMLRALSLLALGVAVPGGVQAADIVSLPTDPAPVPTADTAVQRPAMMGAINRLGLEMLGARIRATRTQNANIALSPLNIGYTLSLLLSAGQGEALAALSERLGQAHPATLAGLIGPDDPGAAALIQAAGLWHVPALVPRSDLPPGLPVPQPYTGVDSINNWVREQTKGRISRMLEPLPASTLFVLAGTLFFQSGWTLPFDPTETRPEPFRRGQGEPVSVPMMRRLHPLLPVREQDGIQAASLSYPGDYALFLVRPAADADPEILFKSGELDMGWFDLDTYRRQRTFIMLPRLSISDMTDLAGERAVLPGLLPPKADLTHAFQAPAAVDLSTALHRVAVAWDEAGTTVAAATAVAGVRSVPLPAPEWRFDAPFLYAVRHLPTGALIACGVVRDPSI